MKKKIKTIIGATAFFLAWGIAGGLETGGDITLGKMVALVFCFGLVIFCLLIPQFLQEKPILKKRD